MTRRAQATSPTSRAARGEAPVSDGVVRARVEALARGLEVAIIEAVRAALEGAERPRGGGKRVKLEPEALGRLLLGQLGEREASALASALGREVPGRGAATGAARKQSGSDSVRKQSGSDSVRKQSGTASVRKQAASASPGKQAAGEPPRARAKGAKSTAGAAAKKAAPAAPRAAPRGKASAAARR
jgi:hypothetical protein